MPVRVHKRGPTRTVVSAVTLSGKYKRGGYKLTARDFGLRRLYSVSAPPAQHPHPVAERVTAENLGRPPVPTFHAVWDTRNQKLRLYERTGDGMQESKPGRDVDGVVLKIRAEGEAA
ncbi:MAG TPA: hypothetical protein VE780_15425 [Thermoleophilaceae bacterium]|nr:hypothetical protein [Thermoleophilaceae bacterium]